MSALNTLNQRLGIEFFLAESARCTAVYSAACAQPAENRIRLAIGKDVGRFSTGRADTSAASQSRFKRGDALFKLRNPARRGGQLAPLFGGFQGRQYVTNNTHITPGDCHERQKHTRNRIKGAVDHLFPALAGGVAGRLPVLVSSDRRDSADTRAALTQLDSVNPHGYGRDA